MRAHGPLIAYVGVLLALNSLHLGGPIPAMALTWALMLVRPAYAPYGLIAVAAIQDTPNISAEGSYVLFGGAALIVFARVAMADLWRLTRDWARAASNYRRLFYGAAILVIYGFMVSLGRHAIGGKLSEFDRPYWLIVASMFLMIGSAYASVKLISADPAGLSRVRATALVMLAHAAVIALLQLWLGQEPFRSPAGILDAGEGTDVVVPTALGFPRLTGTFLSPNDLACEVSLITILVMAGTRDWTISLKGVLFFGITGVVFSVATFSKSTLAFTGLATVFMLWRVLAWRSIAIAAGALLLAALFVSAEQWQALLTSFRFLNLDETVRTSMWDAALTHLAVNDWLFGGGYSFWRDFFQETIGATAGEPHTFVLAIPGTFGVLGVAFYLWLFHSLVSAYRHSYSERVQFMLAALMIYIFVKEALTEQAVLGRTVFTYWIWLALGLAMLKAQESYSAVTTRRSGPRITMQMQS